jgi:hypothetical protein
MGSIAAWEEKLVADSSRETRRAVYDVAIKGLSMMDVPPYNCQAPMMMPMMQKLFNVPSTFVRMSGFTMYDKNGTPYVPSQGGAPAV